MPEADREPWSRLVRSYLIRGPLPAAAHHDRRGARHVYDFEERAELRRPHILVALRHAFDAHIRRDRAAPAVVADLFFVRQPRPQISVRRRVIDDAVDVVVLRRVEPDLSAEVR